MRRIQKLIFVVAIISAVLAIGSKPTRYERLRSPEKHNILILDHACGLFEVTMGRMPVNADELLNPPKDEEERAKWIGPYIDKINSDPWGHPYRFEGDGKSRPRIWSIGPDGINGTGDDISND